MTYTPSDDELEAMIAVEAEVELAEGNFTEFVTTDHDQMLVIAKTWAIVLRGIADNPDMVSPTALVSLLNDAAEAMDTVREYAEGLHAQAN